MSEQPEVPEIAAQNYQINEADLLMEPEPETPPSVSATDGGSAPPPSLDQYAAAMLRIAEAMEKQQARQEAVRQIPFNEVVPDTPFNPTGDRHRKGFSRPTFLHGIALNPIVHTQAEMDLFNKLKPGRYLDRKVEVQRSNDGSINVKWEGKNRDLRIEFYSKYPTITLLLDAIIKDREAKEQKRKLGLTDEEEDFR